MKKHILALALLSACAGTDPQDIGTVEQPIKVFAHAGWLASASTPKFKTCANVVGEHCILPGYDHVVGSGCSGLGPYDRCVSDTTTALWETGMSPFSAAVAAENLWNAQTGYVFHAAGGSPNFDLKIADDANIASPNALPNTTQDFSQFYRLQCTTLIPLSGDTGNEEQCNHLTAFVDTGSFKLWANQWATTNAQKQAAQNKLYARIFGHLVGAGSDIVRTGAAVTDVVMNDKWVPGAVGLNVLSSESCGPAHTDTEISNGVYVDHPACP